MHYPKNKSLFFRSGKINLANFVGNFFFTASLLPWVSFGLNNHDSQPWPFIFCLTFLLLLSPKIRLPPYSVIIIFLVIFGLIFTTGRTETINSFDLFRAIIGYLSVPLFYIAFYNYYTRYDFPIKLFFAINFLWLVMGLIEFFLPEIGGLFASNRTTLDRGVTSLAPEPTFFAMYLFFSSWILIEVRNKIDHFRKYIFLMLCLNFLGVVFLAKSSMILLFYILVLFAFLLAYLPAFRISKKFILIFIIIVALIFIILLVGYFFLIDSRLYRLSVLLFSGYSFFDLAISDASINQRIESIYFSIRGSFSNYLFPGGLDTFITTRDSLLSNTGHYFWYLSSSNKIMSWIGSFVYELGFFGVLSIAAFFAAVYRKFRGSICYFFVLFFILLSAIPIAFPLLPMLLAVLVSKKLNERKVFC